jgi:hypothetical protein
MLSGFALHLWTPQMPFCRNATTTPTQPHGPSNPYPTLTHGVVLQPLSPACLTLARVLHYKHLLLDPDSLYTPCRRCIEPRPASCIACLSLLLSATRTSKPLPPPCTAFPCLPPPRPLHSGPVLPLGARIWTMSLSPPPRILRSASYSLVAVLPVHPPLPRTQPPPAAALAATRKLHDTSSQPSSYLPNPLPPTPCTLYCCSLPLLPLKILSGSVPCTHNFCL